MKKLFFSLVALMIATMSYAQNTLVATLSHGEDISMYYGTYALRDAVNAAESGDVINLSGGVFQAVDITKALTLRGTGIDDAAPTYISYDFNINLPSDDISRLSMEGIRCTGNISMKGTYNNPYFAKCQFYSISYDSNSSAIKNALFVNCKIERVFHLYGISTVQFINCFISSFSNNSTATATATFVNCILIPGTDSSHNYNYMACPYDISSSQLQNCIICTPLSNQQYGLPSTSVATNCVAVNFSNLFGNQTGNANNTTTTFAELFKDFTGTYSDSQTFELTDEAKTNYLGTDGIEVGLYGGFMPYTSTLSYPQITKMNVANKATADGKLSVEIEVSAAE